MVKFDYEKERKEKILSELNELYEKVPKVKCQGHCHPFCSAIAMEHLELMNIEKNHSKFPQGFENPVDRGQTIRCGALDSNNQCTVYDSRPMICRMFGAAQSMVQCPVGCELENPSDERLSPEKMMALLLEVKLLNAKLNVPTTYHRIIRRFENNLEVDLESELPEAYYNVSRDLWEVDMNPDSEELKTKYTLANQYQVPIENIDMEEYREIKKWRVVQSIIEALKDTRHKGTINILNSDTNTEIEFKREELIGKSVLEIYKMIFLDSIIANEVR